MGNPPDILFDALGAFTAQSELALADVGADSAAIVPDIVVQVYAPFENIALETAEIGGTVAGVAASAMTINNASRTGQQQDQIRARLQQIQNQFREARFCPINKPR